MKQIWGWGAVLAASCAWAGSGTITIDAKGLGAKISPGLYGIFLEEISNAGEGGLYAELIQNRSFEDANIPTGCHVEHGHLIPPRTPHFAHPERPGDWTMPWPNRSPHPAWTSSANVKIATTREHPLNSANPTALRADTTAKGWIENEGFWGIRVDQGADYDLTVHTYGQTFRGTLTAQLIDPAGKILGELKLKQPTSGKWAKQTARLRAAGSAAAAKFRIQLEGSGVLLFDHVSLFPAKTFKGRPNGLRPDLVSLIQGLRPSFVRWPGGCVVEGITVDNRPRWEQTLGPVEGRPPTYVPWGYWNTNGFGYHEWLQFCEDIGAEPLYVFNVGVSCYFRSGTFLEDAELPALIHNTLDAIEYAIGPADSKWGAVRAKNGHPKPFKMSVVEIGNEQQGARYGERVAMFRRAIKAKYPHLKVALSSWITGIDQAAIRAAGPIEIVDEHAYRPINWAIANYDSFAKYPRTAGYEIYIGEFATNSGVGRGNLHAALNDAVYMLSMERSGDIVTMGSYAPLLENVNTPDWQVNLIRFKSNAAYGRSSYHACRMFAENLPTVNLATRVDYKQANAAPIRGPIGLGTFSTAVDFKDIVVESGGKVVYQSDFSTDTGWSGRGGQWSVADGAYRQSRPEGEHWRYFGRDFENIVLRAKARKREGVEGFLISVGDADSRRVQFNVGGWGNTLHAIQAGDVVRQKRGSVEANRWYDVRIESTGRQVKAYLDNELIFDETLPRVDTLISSAALDEKTGDVILRAVNCGPETATMSVAIQNGNVTGTATETILTSAQPTDENNFESPDRVAPKTRQITGIKSTFEHRFLPYSLTILRIPTRR